jgi:hypothetical protein
LSSKPSTAPLQKKETNKKSSDKINKCAIFFIVNIKVKIGKFIKGKKENPLQKGGVLNGLSAHFNLNEYFFHLKIHLKISKTEKKKLEEINKHILQAWLLGCIRRWLSVGAEGWCGQS